MPPDSTNPASMPAVSRSRVTNLSSLFIGAAGGRPIDGRTVQARRFRDVLEAILSDLGGRDGLSEGEIQLARRCAALSVQCEVFEAHLAAGHDFDHEGFVTMVNALNRTLRSIGLRRRARDVTPDLRSYIAGKAEVVP